MQREAWIERRNNLSQYGPLRYTGVGTAGTISLAPASDAVVPLLLLLPNAMTSRRVSQPPSAARHAHNITRFSPICLSTSKVDEKSH